jgi:adenine-specific DNA-methyltransferase
MTPKAQAYAKTEALVQRFAAQIDSYKTQYKEDRLRIDFIDPFFEALGWDIRNAAGLPEAYRDVVYEDSVEVATTDGDYTRKEPDYAFTIAGKRQFYVEAKQPAVNVETHKQSAMQTRAYGWSAKLPISILTDFEEFALYDCSKKPKDHDTAGTARIKYLYYTDYLKEFDFLWSNFSREAVFNGSIDKWRRKDKKGTEEVDVVFLEQLTAWRKTLAQGIAEENHTIEVEEIRFAVQMILDRIIFLRICEDRGIEPYKHLLKLARSKGDVYQVITTYFKDAARKYNSGLFEFVRKDTITEKLKVRETDLLAIIHNLYPPNVFYRFDIMPTDILGNVYEQFLGKVISFTQGSNGNKGKLSRKIEVDYKPEVRKAGGVYYTPEYVVDYIIQNTLAKLLQGKTPADIATLSVIDPSCGSGAFLIKAYQTLLDFYYSYYYAEAHNPKTKLSATQLRQKLNPTKKLHAAEKKQILLRHIYGVDIDEQAVEVTKLNLLLKALEGTTEADIKDLTQGGKEKVLADLDQNICVGNSLIGKDYKDRTAKPFDWQTAFPQVFRQGGFDCVIGNPPYVRLQTMEKGLTDYYKQKYIGAGIGNYDLYILFIEKGFNILKNNGFFGVILPHKFFQAVYGEPIRQFIAKNKALYQINDFTTNQLFKDATTYTCLLFLSKQNNSYFDYQKIELKDDVIKELQNPKFQKININVLDKGKWNFSADDKSDLLEKLKNENIALQEFTRKIFKGSSTGNDDVYLVDLVKDKGKISTVFSKILNKNVDIEKEILKPFVFGGDIKRYVKTISNTKIIFPYKKDNNKMNLISFDDLRKKYPLTFNYFQELKSVLNLRKIETTDTDFYKYSAGRSLIEYEQEKILVPDIVDAPKSTFDLVGDLFHGPAIHSIVFNEKGNKLNKYYFLGVLNSKVFWFFLSNTSTALRGNYYRVIPEFLEPFPIPDINLQNKQQKNLHDTLVGLVEDMLQYQAEAHKGGLLPYKQQAIEGDIAYTARKIDEVVYTLYGLSEAEIALIENS